MGARASSVRMMSSLADFTAPKLNADGETSLSDFKGKPVVIVNVASL